MTTGSNRPDVETSYKEPTLAGWAHLVWADGARRIYLGPQQTASVGTRLQLKAHHVMAIVNCTNRFPNHHEDNDITYCRVAVNDEPGANILVYLDGAADFIHAQFSNNNDNNEQDKNDTSVRSVLVHCQMGVSRSTTVVLAYLMKYHGMTRDSAHQHVKERRPQAGPNYGFWDQLFVYEQRLRSKQQARDRKGEGSSSSFQSVTFDYDWAQQSVATYQTLSGVVGSSKELFPELIHVRDAKTTMPTSIQVGLDYILGRGTTKADTEWFGALCDAWRDKCSDRSSVEAVVTSLLSPGTEFFENWSEDLKPAHIGRVLGIAVEKCEPS